MRAHDTTPAAHALQIRAYRAMGAAQRAELGLRLSDDLRQIAAEGIRRRHPKYSEGEVRKALVVLFYGKEIAANVWPNEPVPAP
jgi:hypothetical protein